MLYVVKSRGMAHSHEIREFVLSEHGLNLADVYQRVPSMTGGTTSVEAADGTDSDTAVWRLRLYVAGESPDVPIELRLLRNGPGHRSRTVTRVELSRSLTRSVRGSPPPRPHRERRRRAPRLQSRSRVSLGRRPHPGRQEHRAAQPALPRVRRERGLARSRAHRHRPHRLDPAALLPRHPHPRPVRDRRVPLPRAARRRPHHPKRPNDPPPHRQTWRWAAHIANGFTRLRAASG